MTVCVFGGALCANKVCVSVCAVVLRNPSGCLEKEKWEVKTVTRVYTPSSKPQRKWGFWSSFWKKTGRRSWTELVYLRYPVKGTTDVAVNSNPLCNYYYRRLMWFWTSEPTLWCWSELLLRTQTSVSLFPGVHILQWKHIQSSNSRWCFIFQPLQTSTVTPGSCFRHSTASLTCSQMKVKQMFV